MLLPAFTFRFQVNTRLLAGEYSVAVSCAGRVTFTRAAKPVRFCSVTVGALATWSTNFVWAAAVPRATTRSIALDSTAIVSAAGATTVPAATVGTISSRTWPSWKPRSARAARAASTPSPVTLGTARSTGVRMLLLPAPSSCTSWNRRVSPGSIAPSFASNSVGPNCRYSPPLTTRMTLPSWPLESVPGSQRIVRPSSATTPAMWIGGVGASSSSISAKKLRWRVSTWTLPPAT